MPKAKEAYNFSSYLVFQIHQDQMVFSSPGYKIIALLHQTLQNLVNKSGLLLFMTLTVLYKITKTVTPIYMSKITIFEVACQCYLRKCGAITKNLPLIGLVLGSCRLQKHNSENWINGNNWVLHKLCNLKKFITREKPVSKQQLSQK